MARLKTVSTILRLKEWQKEEVELQYKDLRRALDAEEDALDYLKNEQNSAMENVANIQQGGAVGVQDLNIYYDYIENLSDRIKAQKGVIEEKQKELDAKHDELVEAYREKKTVEILQNKVVKEIERENASAERKEQDFLWLAKHLRESKE